MNNNLSKDIFERYAAGICTDEEKAMVEGWYLSELQQDDHRPSDGQLLVAKEEIWNGIRPQHRTVSLMKWISVAAVVSLAILFYIFQKDAPVESTISAQKQSVKNTEIFRDEVLIGSKIENTMFKLSDGSLVILQKGSKLTLLSTFNRKHNREVELEGKAFFDIAHNPAKPFIIYSGNVKTRVMGTAFDVTAIPGTETVKINVVRGLVEVTNTKSHRTTYLKKNMQVVSDETNKFSSRKFIDPEKEMAWNQQDLEFNDISLEDARSRLEDQFGYKISVKDRGLQKATFTYSMRAKESPESFIKSICEFIGASYTIDHKNNIININSTLNQ